MAAIVLLLAGGGCNLSHGSKDGPNLTLIVRGVSGDAEYGPIAKSLERPDTFVSVFTWGAPRPLFVMNFSNSAIHNAAEQQLAADLQNWHTNHPAGQINLVGHSAGCGVILGALPRIGGLHVRNVVLLAPSVSPGYSLEPALGHVDGQLHSFYSDRDTMFLRWRTGNFGTYDGVRTPAAGNEGFVGKYSAAKFIQHAYDPKWQALGYDGGHFSIIASEFAARVIAPLLTP